MLLKLVPHRTVPVYLIFPDGALRDRSWYKTLSGMVCGGMVWHRMVCGGMVEVWYGMI